MADRPWQVEYRQQIAVQSSSIWECELDKKNIENCVILAYRNGVSYDTSKRAIHSTRQYVVGPNLIPKKN